MPTPIMYVCVNRRFDPGMTAEQLKEIASGNWDITVAKATTCQRVVAMHFKAPIGAWELKGAFRSTEAHPAGHHRTGLVLGDALPVLDEYWNYPSLRHGVAVGVAADDEPAVLASEPQVMQLGKFRLIVERSDVAVLQMPAGATLTVFTTDAS